MNVDKSAEKEIKPESHNGSHTGYRVEVRHSYHEPMQFGGMIFDKEWREVGFPESATAGVPIGARWEMPELVPFRCYSYQAAQALRWWLHAEIEAKHMLGGLCLESRLVSYEIKYSRECFRRSEHVRIGGDDRSNCIPDWGTKL